MAADDSTTRMKGIGAAGEMAGGPSSQSAELSPTGQHDNSMTNQQATDVRAQKGGLKAGSTEEPRYGDLNEQRSRDRGEESLRVQAEGSAHTDAETGQTEMSMKLQPKPKEKLRSLAETRGVNWGLSAAARSSNPITRPIHMLCEGDKLLIRPDGPSDPALAVPLKSRTEDSVDELVMAVQERIKDWGIAGRGLYWRPQLILEVGHSGEGRYADLAALLADSGFDVKRR